MNTGIIHKRWWALCAVLIACIPLSAPAKLFVPDSELWAIWDVADDSNSSEIKHTEWQSLLDAYLITATADGIHRFNYAAVSRADRQHLQGYLERLSAIDPRDYSRAEQLAYWINLYNALTVEVVLEHYPVRSIRTINGGLFNTGPWDTNLVTVAGAELTLNDIEHRILRPIWNDPRIHYAVNCASLGCPNLAAQSYSADNSEQLLDAGARAFINSPRGVAVTAKGIKASSIYNWYDIDFGASKAALLEHWQEYANPELATQLNGFEGKIRYDYNWELNQP